MTAPPAPAACLPPDPGVAGLWWVRRGDRWQVWQWRCLARMWAAPGTTLEPWEAHQEGWRVVGRAVPPGEDGDG